ncbi:hypothetical protein [Planococcus salinarum]|nr:hypothetical protein [Planococcus salinarum]
MVGFLRILLGIDDKRLEIDDKPEKTDDKRVGIDDKPEKIDDKLKNR